MTHLNKSCCLCNDDVFGKRPVSTHAYFVGNTVWRGVCDKHAVEQSERGLFVATVDALLKGADIKMEK